MSVKDELLFDFSINLPRVLVCGNITVVDNVKRIVLFGERQIVVHTGNVYTDILGKALIVKELSEERMIITGVVEQIRFYETL